MLTQRQRKFETLQPKPSLAPARGATWGAAQARCSSTALPSDYITPPVALVQQCSSRGAARRSSRAAASAAGKLRSIFLACNLHTLHNTITLHLTVVRSSVRSSVRSYVRTSVKFQSTSQSKVLVNLHIIQTSIAYNNNIWQKTTRWNTPLYNLTGNTNTFTFFLVSWDLIMSHLVGIDKGPVMDWTNDIGLGERYRKWEEMCRGTIQGATQCCSWGS